MGPQGRAGHEWREGHSCQLLVQGRDGQEHGDRRLPEQVTQLPLAAERPFAKPQAAPSIRLSSRIRIFSMTKRKFYAMGVTLLAAGLLGAGSMMTLRTVQAEAKKKEAAEALKLAT